VVIGKPIPVLYVQMDGTGVPVVKKETEGRKGKKGRPARTCRTPPVAATGSSALRKVRYGITTHMSKRLPGIAILPLIASLPAFAGSLLVSGNAMNAASTFTDNLDQLTGTTYTIVQPQFFGSESLSGFNVIWLDGFSLYQNLPNLLPWLNNGGTLLVQNPGFGSNSLSEYPSTTGLNISFSNSDTVRILDRTSPFAAGLTSAGLSNWGSSSYGYFSVVPTGWDVISDDGTSGEDLTIAMNVGAGRLIYTEQGVGEYLSANSFSAGDAPVQFVQDVVAGPEPGTSILIVSGVAALAFGVRRLRPALTDAQKPRL